MPKTKEMMNKSRTKKCKGKRQGKAKAKVKGKNKKFSKSFRRYFLEKLSPGLGEENTGAQASETGDTQNHPTQQKDKNFHGKVCGRLLPNDSFQQITQSLRKSLATNTKQIRRRAKRSRKRRREKRKALLEERLLLTGTIEANPVNSEQPCCSKTIQANGTGSAFKKFFPDSLAGSPTRNLSRNSPKSAGPSPKSCKVIEVEDDLDEEDDCLIIEASNDPILIDDDDEEGEVQDEETLTNKKDQEKDTNTGHIPDAGSSHSLNHSAHSSTPSRNSSTNSSNCFPFFEDTTPNRLASPGKVPVYPRGPPPLRRVSSSSDECEVIVINDSFEQSRDRHEVSHITIEDSFVEPVELHPSRRENKENNFNQNRPLETSSKADDSLTLLNGSDDFIPLTENGEPEAILVKDLSKKSPRRIAKDILTRKERKQLEAYSDNAYDPNPEAKKLEKKRMVIIDGSNVAFAHSLNQGFSVKGLKICIEFFEKMGHEVKAVVPMFRQKANRCSDPQELLRLHNIGKVIYTPCKNIPGYVTSSYDDRFILQLASQLDCAVISNDCYRDLIPENSAFKKIIENRVVGYTWCNDVFLLPKDPYGRFGPSLHEILNRF